MRLQHKIGDQNLAGAIEDKLIPFIEQVVAACGLAGLAIGIVKAGELVYAQGFGVRNLDTQEPVTPRSLFHLASISKTFVATAIVQLVEQGEIALDVPVITYLPYFQLQDSRYQAITFRQMLNHTSGMAHELGDYQWHAPEDDEEALERYVRSLADEELIAAPGEKYGYSNIAFDVLGDVIAKVSGQPFEAYMKAHLLEPLAMHDSTFLRREVAPDLAVTPHFGAPLRVLPGIYPYHRAHGPSGMLHSSVAEMSQWAIANLNRGRFQSRQIIQPESHALLWRPTVPTGDEGWGEAVGLSWFFGKQRGHPIIHHGGSDPGFGAQLVFVPTADAAVVVLTNDNGAGNGIVTDAAVDLLLGLEPEMPKIPITAPVGATLAAAGSEAALAQYQRLITQPERYDAHPDRFLEATWGAIEVQRPDVVLPLVQLWVTLQPDAALAYEMLGWVYMVQGEQELAADKLRRALTLDPEAWHARILLQQIGRRGVDITHVTAYLVCLRKLGGWKPSTI
jgi:CubicO group peptidase (beta-lactamase class C family)